MIGHSKGVELNKANHGGFSGQALLSLIENIRDNVSYGFLSLAVVLKPN